jgi:hypothetical protein
MTVQCIACADFAFQKGPNKRPLKIATQGAGKCKHDAAVGATVSALYGRDCDKYTANDDTKVAKLRAWLAKPKGEQDYE